MEKIEVVHSVEPEFAHMGDIANRCAAADGAILFMGIAKMGWGAGHGVRRSARDFVNLLS